jgi:branched-chain amino acid transport system ATP-binding protein
MSAATLNEQSQPAGAQADAAPPNRTAAMNLLVVENVRRSFGGLVAVEDVSFATKQGQVKAIIGPNGAGKTTLFNLISGLLKTERGRITFKGEPITGLEPFEIARTGMSRTFQNPNLFLRMSALENVMVGRHVRSRAGFLSCGFRLPGQSREEASIREAALEQLEFVGLAHLAEFPAASLAFGQRRMVELARALATQPEMLLLDEPASGLNTREKLDLSALIRRIRDRGITVLLVEHDVPMVMKLSDEILVLHNGSRIAEGAPETIQNDPKVISVYLGGELENAAASKKPQVRLRHS